MSHSVEERAALIAALEKTFVALGKLGVNASVNHPQRQAWEQARDTLKLVGALK